MATKVVMEALSPTMEEGRLVKWAKNEGDQVAQGDVLAEVETDKAVMELVARGEGILRKRVVGEGQSVPVGTLVGVIAGADENIDSLVAAAPAQQAAQPQQQPAQAAAQARETVGATSVRKSPAQSQGEASAPSPPPPQEKAAPQGQAPAAPPPSPPAADGANRPAASPAGGRMRSSPLARRMASDRGLELGGIQGSGPGGRIVRRDVESAAARPSAASPLRRERSAEEFVDVPLTQIRKTIAKRLVESIGPVPTFYLTAEFAMDRAAEMRASLAEIGDEYKASFNDIVVRAVALSLAEHPEVNAHWLGDKVRQFNRVRIGMAVAIEGGLITPVIFDADQKSLHEISREARELAGKARDRKLTPEQYTGSTFSVSNLGMFGIDQFTAIINPPEAGILAIGAVESKPVVEDGEVRIRQRMRVTMSCDHRVIDGATGAKFLQTVRRYIEHPLLLVI